MNKSTIIKTLSACAASAVLSASALSMLTMHGCTEENGISNAFLNLRKTDIAYVTDSRDGKKYRTVKIGNFNWMAENVNYPIQYISYCYGNKEANCEKYGRLYRWETAGFDVCPTGWHLPTKAEWDYLWETVGRDAGALRSKEWGGTDKYGFSALPGGFNPNGYTSEGKDTSAVWWSANDYTASDSVYYAAAWRMANGGEGYKPMSKWDDRLSVRCVENNGGAARRYFVKFESGTATYNLQTVSVAEGTSLGARYPNLTVDNMSGKVFDGWFDKDAGTVQYTKDTPINKNLSLVARWKGVD